MAWWDHEDLKSKCRLDGTPWEEENDMANHELPKMKAGTYATSVASYGGDTIAASNTWTTGVMLPHSELPKQVYWGGDDEDLSSRKKTIDRQIIGAHLRALARAQAEPQLNSKPKKEKPKMATKRLVRVIVVDAHEYVKVEDAILYRSDETFTDKTDQELFFDIPIAKLLDDHNTRRVKVRNKKVKEREEFLEPARIRDLNMVVLTIAEF